MSRHKWMRRQIRKQYGDAMRDNLRLIWVKLCTLPRRERWRLAWMLILRDTDLDKATPESMKEYAPTVGSVFNIIGIHEMMHGGQFVPLRRKLNKPVMI